ncbi:prepilin-type N-terminal cleavage/methylation domain-containing protein [Methylovorus sp. MM2]|uniref:prepilin-type N-terminal cleavage/methylation domain-containing protein n=1 Tax=Methylovorus sp. MM2 TaxID=1848038 RepID=UPI0007E2801A|nr:prepilin-type N-terminal cleavage/methylation domain-containing protein [Methylovorus sp. MM2]OAM51737.1 prepilin-type N-terminal cleavage/methylation domain-containing protein [Methylovorus sp. MM2]
MKKQSGFTLIELAIVLVIIGLLLGGVLKGQELINNARVKNMASDFRNIQTYIYGYQDRFRALPGDDRAVIAHLGALATPAANGTQNGLIEGAWDSSAIGDESFLFWQHVRLANLAPGPTNTADANYRPRNANGGSIGIQSVAAFNKITNMTGSFAVCSDGILGTAAIDLDVLMDDGDTSTGSMRATPTAVTGAAATVTANIIPANAYTVCMAF